jgi:hypothetical protein
MVVLLIEGRPSGVNGPVGWECRQPEAPQLIIDVALYRVLELVESGEVLEDLFQTLPSHIRVCETHRLIAPTLVPKCGTKSLAVQLSTLD